MKNNTAWPSTTLTNQATLNSSLLDLLDLLHIPLDNTLASIMRATQEAWVRKPGTERWLIQEQYIELSVTPMIAKPDVSTTRPTPGGQH